MNMMMKKYLLVIFLISLDYGADGPSLQFFREDLQFYLEGGKFRVDGLYYFRNAGDQPVKHVLFYPFPPVEKYGPVDSVFVNPENDTTSLIVHQTTKGCYFQLKIPAGDKRILHIGYRQLLKDSLAKYIVTTTQIWKMPFEQAGYTLMVNDSLTVVSFSVKPDSAWREGQYRRYIWQRRNFMPDRDFEFVFRKDAQ